MRQNMENKNLGHKNSYDRGFDLTNGLINGQNDYLHGQTVRLYREAIQL